MGINCSQTVKRFRDFSSSSPLWYQACIGWSVVVSSFCKCLEFGHHYSEYDRVIVMATALSSSSTDSGYQTHSSRWWKNWDVCYGLINKQVKRPQFSHCGSRLSTQSETTVFSPDQKSNICMRGGGFIDLDAILSALKGNILPRSCIRCFHIDH